jgi:hypothetical protein
VYHVETNPERDSEGTVRRVTACLIALAAVSLLQAGEPEYLDDFGKALDEAQERGAPIVVVFLRSS